MPFLTELITLGALLVIGGVVLLAINNSRRKKYAYENQIRQLGFEALNTAPRELERRVLELYQTRGEREIKTWRIYHRQELDQDLYLFDVVDSSGDSSEIGSEVFGLISPGLALPRFSLVTLPDINRSSLVSSLMDKILDKVMNYAEGYLQLQRVEFPDQPDLDDRLLLFGQDPTAVRQMLERVGLYSLTHTKMRLRIAGSGDFITVDFSIPSSSNQPDRDLISCYQTFVEITHRFMV